MKKLMLSLFLACLSSGCPNASPDSFPKGIAIARATIQGAHLALAAADGVFEIWAALADADKVPAARATYTKIRASVVAGLVVASDGIALAESQGKGLDLVALMLQANTAWADLRAFLATLTSQPTSQPKDLKYRAPTVDDLPLTLYARR